MPQLLKRKEWSNHINDQVAEPLGISTPASIEELVEVVKFAESKHLKVKPVGSGHSWSDVCKTTGLIVKPNGLTKVLEIEFELLQANAQLDKCVKVESGITVKDLNEYLESQGLGLKNMGGYDGQTIVGATSTSTHGSGIKYGPMSDMIIAYEIVGSNGKIYRIESSKGLVDPSKYNSKYPNRELIQNDEYLNAVRVSLGCIGIIYSVVLEARAFYYLKETRVLKTWSQVKEDIIKNKVIEKYDHYEVLIHPYLKDKNYKCLVTTREETEKPVKLPADKLKRNVMVELFSSLPLVAKLSKYLFDVFPSWTEELLEKAIEALEDDSYVNKSYKVYNIGEANYIPSYSSEIALPIKDNFYLEGIEKMLQSMDTNRKIGELYQTAPIALRFVKGTDSMMSPQYKSDTCMVEIIMIKDTHGGKEMYEILENDLYDYGGRPHWGQFNYVTQSKIEKYNLYPKMDVWLKVKNRINSTGVFDNYFSSRIGANN